MSLFSLFLFENLSQFCNGHFIYFVASIDNQVTECVTEFKVVTYRRLSSAWISEWKASFFFWY